MVHRAVGANCEGETLMNLRQTPMLASAALFVIATVGGCAQPDRDDADPPAAEGSRSPTTSEPPTVTGTPPASQPAPPESEPTAEAVDYRVTYDWGVPSEQVTVPHEVPALDPSGPTLPYLVAVYVGDHPEEDPPYQRIAFYFREAFPEYNLQYVREVVQEGSGEPIDLEGNAFLRVGFVNAQAHDNDGASTVETAPDETIGFFNLKSYGSAGDFEGHLTFGLGLQVAPASDQVLLIRAGELKRPDGSDDFYYVVHVDVQTGLFG
jgi:hypothetical protein